MREVVIDASAALDLVFDEATPSVFSDPVMHEITLTAPWIWRLEVVNAVLVREQRRLLTQAQATGCLQFLDAMNIAFVGESTERGLERLAAFAQPLQLTAHDAVYVELALLRALPLLTTDRNIKDAAQRLNIELLE